MSRVEGPIGAPAVFCGVGHNLKFGHCSKSVTIIVTHLLTYMRWIYGACMQLNVGANINTVIHATAIAVIYNVVCVWGEMAILLFRPLSIYRQSYVPNSMEIYSQLLVIFIKQLDVDGLAYFHGQSVRIRRAVSLQKLILQRVKFDE